MCMHRYIIAMHDHCKVGKLTDLVIACIRLAYFQM